MDAIVDPCRTGEQGCGYGYRPVTQWGAGKLKLCQQATGQGCQRGMATGHAKARGGLFPQPGIKVQRTGPADGEFVPLHQNVDHQQGEQNTAEALPADEGKQ